MSSSASRPLPPSPPPAASGWHASLFGALDGASSNIPLSLGCATLVFLHLGPTALASGLFATMMALVVIHLATIGSQRPVIYSARIFEATTIAAMMDQVVTRLPAWGLPDTEGVRLACFCLVGAGAGLAVGVLYVLRADRLTRFIPAPVFAGFSNSIALALLISQSGALWQLVSQAPSLPVVVSIGSASLLTALLLHRWRPRWPSAAAALAAGLIVSLGWLALGHPVPTVGTGSVALALPFALADFKALADPAVQLRPALQYLVAYAAILGIMIFINTTMTAQALARIDDRRHASRRDTVLEVACIALGGLAGSAPLSGGIMASTGVTRTTTITPKVIGLTAVTMALTYFSGVLGWVPLVAVCTALLWQAWFLADRPSLRLLVDWLRWRPMASNAREDLALIVAVTASAVFVNMVAAVFIGLLLGLVLFAVRNARQAVRQVWTGRQLSSNCARSREDLRLLAEHGDAIRIFELEGNLFFGVADSLEHALVEGSRAMSSVVVDWSRVRHVDTSVALAVAQFERKVREHGLHPIHAAVDPLAGAIGPALYPYLPSARFAPDLDRGLELAENDLIQAVGRNPSHEATALLESAVLFAGLNEAEQAHVEAAMEQKLFDAGEVIVEA